MTPSNLYWFFVSLAILYITSTTRASPRHPLQPCPKECHCTVANSVKTLHCTSLNFIDKTSPKTVELYTSLNLSSLSLTSLDKRLKKFTNLEWLTLSDNKLTDLDHFPHFKKLTHLNLRSNFIKSFSAKHLPSTLINLDVSHNLLNELPADITRLHSLKRIDINGNSFSCNRESLDTRDSLLEHSVHIVGKVSCQDPPNFKGQSWLHAVDFDEYFKLQDQHGMLGDDPGSGDGDQSSGDGEMIIEEVIVSSSVRPLDSGIKIVDSEVSTAPKMEGPTTTESDFGFEGSGMGNSGLPERVSESSTIIPRIDSTSENPEKHANMGTNIFLGIFMVILVSLLIYAVKRNKQKKREAKAKRRNEKAKQKPMIEMMPKSQRKPSDKQNGNTDSVPLMNGQNGNSKQDALREAEEGTVPNTQPLLPSDHTDSTNGTFPSAPPPDVKAVKVKASELPDSVPHTPILVNRSRSSDGKSIVVTPKTSPRNA